MSAQGNALGSGSSVKTQPQESVLILNRHRIRDLDGRESGPPRWGFQSRLISQPSALPWADIELPIWGGNQDLNNPVASGK